jgi:hypothetical protein
VRWRTASLKVLEGIVPVCCSMGFVRDMCVHRVGHRSGGPHKRRRLSPSFPRRPHHNHNDVRTTQTPPIWEFLSIMATR